MHDHGVLLTLTGHVVIIAMQVIGFVYAWKRDGRRHRWQQEAQKQLRDLDRMARNGQT